MKHINPKEINDNVFDTIGKEWMIVSVGNAENYNMMTASWGGLGWLWNKPVAFVFIRPERYTFPMTESEDYLTLSFLGNSEEARRIYGFCGSKSGREVNKMKESGLQLIDADNNCIKYEQARLTLKCRKLYADDLRESAFVDSSLVERWYGEAGGYHKMYVVEIEDALIKE